MVRDLRNRYDDRFSEYFSPRLLAYFNEAISGHFSGIGLSVTKVKRGMRVVHVFPRSPAQEASIKLDDVIVSVDGESIAGQSSEVATAKIKGPEGTDVVVGVLSSGEKKARQVKLTRAEIEIPVVSSEVSEVDGREMGYVRLTTFSEGAHGALRDAVEKVEKQGAEGIVLDLRNNGGGLLEEAVLSASIFLPEDEIVVSTESRTEGDAVYRTVGGNLPERPVVVLIDGNTASAAEILTAALADNAGAEVIGTRSYGKGVFQQEIGLSNGGALKLTIGEYFTPDGTNLAGAAGSSPTSRPATCRARRATRPSSVLSRCSRRNRVNGPRRASGLAGAGPREAACVSRRRGRRPHSRAQAAPKNAREAVEALLVERLGKRGFRPSLEVEANRAESTAQARSQQRRDLTALPTFTVDPATARDFDDAVSAQREGDGVRLWIHIADVSAHVLPGSPLDLEAARRANSTYVPGTVEPMLPHALSEEACSLAPGVERLAVTAEIELGPGGEPRAAAFYRSRIRSLARLDYDQLDVIFGGRAKAPEQVAEPLAVAREAAAALGEKRGTTSLDVESFEPEFRFDSAGNVVGARSVAQTEAHRLIERLMILANEQVAQLLESKRVPTIYRVHAQPDPPRVERLIAQLDALDVPTPPLRQGLAPREAGEVAAAASRLVKEEAARRGHGQDAYTSLVLRSLKPAQYSARNSGHAGLGSPAYCHFTSPIRRYPDLLVHRALLARWGRGRRRRASARPRRSPGAAASRSASRCESSAMPTTSAPLTSSSASSPSVAGRCGSRARSPG